MPKYIIIGLGIPIIVFLFMYLWSNISDQSKNRILISIFGIFLLSIFVTEKSYSSTIEVDLPHKPGVLGHITSLIGLNKGNIVNLEIIKRKKEYLTFSFDLQIKDLKNFTNLISQIKQSDLNFKIIRHKQKKNAFIRRIFENFKRN